MRMTFRPLLLLGCLICFICVPLIGKAGDFRAVKEKLEFQYPDVRMIGVTDLHTMLASEQSPLLLDVRAEKEYRVSQIIGAQNVPNEDMAFAFLADANVPRDTLIVVYCSLGYRSADMARRLRDAGYDNVRNLKGSLFEWVDLDYPVYRGDKRVHEVHPYNFWWGRHLRADYRAYAPGDP